MGCSCLRVCCWPAACSLWGALMVWTLKHAYATCAVCGRDAGKLQGLATPLWPDHGPSSTALPIIPLQCLQGMEALARLRCSRGLSVAGYFGSFHRRGPIDIDLPSINSDQSIAVQLRLDEKLQEGV